MILFDLIFISLAEFLLLFILGKVVNQVKTLYSYGFIFFL